MAQETNPVDPNRALEAGIVQTRARMEGTLHTIEERLAPGRIKAQVMEQIDEARIALKAHVKLEVREIEGAVKKEFSDAKLALREATLGKVEKMAQRVQKTVSDSSGSLLSTIRGNPVPAVLAGVGLAWLFLNRKGNNTVVSRGLDQVVGAAGRMAHDVQERTSQAVGSAGQAADGIVQAVGAQVSHLGENAQQVYVSGKEALTEMSQSAQRGAVNVEHRLGAAFSSNPVGVGAVVLALGTVAGLLIPRTQREDSMMGAARDSLLQKAQEAAEGAVGRVQELASVESGRAAN